MCSVRSSSALGCSVHGNVIDAEVFEVFGVGVGFQVVDQSQNNSDGLFRPSTKSLTELGSLPGSTDTTEVLEVGYTSSVSKNVFEVLFSFGDGETLDSVGSFVGIFIVNSEVLGGGSGN